MSDSIVALISAGGAILGALAGGGVTGVVTLRSTRLQVGVQREARYQDARRTVYLGFLSQITEIERLRLRFPQCRFDAATDHLEEWGSAVHALNGQLNAVALEGPPPVAEAATELVQTQLRRCDLAVDIVVAPQQGNPLVLMIMSDQLDEPDRHINHQRAVFVQRASAALGSHLT